MKYEMQKPIPDDVAKFWEGVVELLPELQYVDIIQQEVEKIESQNSVELILQSNDLSLEHLQPPTRAFININRAIKKIHPSVAIFVNRNVVIHPRWVRESAYYQKQLPTKEGIAAFPRFELIITGKDIAACNMIKFIYLESKKVKLPPDWLIIKFQPPMDHWTRRMIARQAHSQLHVNGIIIPSEKIKFRALMTQKTTLDFTLLIDDHFITTQQDLIELQGETMKLLSNYLGEYKSYQYLDKVRVMQEMLFCSQNSLDGFLPWSEIIPVMDKIFFPLETVKCKCCYIHCANVDLIPLVETYEFIEPGNYCPYCFAFLASLLDKHSSSTVE